MKVTIHIGSHKTGTTSIQKMMASSRRQLLKQGVLYPKIEYNPTNHIALTAGIFIDQPLSRLFRFALSKDGIDNEFYYARQVSSIREQVANENPDELVLSTESLFKNAKYINYDRLLSDLCISKSDVEILVYIRNPADHYLSSMQQQLKHASSIKFPSPEDFRDVIESHEEAFSKKVNVRIYDRDILSGGDSRLDFCSVLGIDNEFMDCSLEESNSTISSEVMWLSQYYRSSYFPESENEPIETHDAFLRKLKRAEKELGLYRKPKLKDCIRSLILKESRHDVHWLENYVGHSLSWQAAEGVDQSPTCLESPLTISDVCNVDFGSALNTLYHSLELSGRD